MFKKFKELHMVKNLESLKSLISSKSLKSFIKLMSSGVLLKTRRLARILSWVSGENLVVGLFHKKLLATPVI